MDLSELPTSADTAATRHDGWTDVRRARFLDFLAGCGNVRAACAHVRLSAEAAYRLRRRDALFARAWAAALMLAREVSAEALGTRALDGIEEEVWYRGEVVGTRRSFDNRLLLAHVARLDKLAEANEAAAADMARFDQLVARAAGIALPDGLASEDGMLPDAREACIEAASGRAEEQSLDMPEDEGIAFYRAARAEAALSWDGWITQAAADVDRLLGLEPGTPSTSSTSRCQTAVAIGPDGRRHAYA